MSEDLNRRFDENNWPRRLIDLICVFIFILALILECISIYSNKGISLITKIHSFFFGYEEGVSTDAVYYFNSIVISLFPIIDTILAISISISKQEIYGIENSDFRKLRKHSFYSVTSMIFISVLLFVASIVFYYTCLIITSLTLCLISITYMLTFLFVEVPLMSHSDRRINNIIRYAYNQSYGNSDIDYSNKDLIDKVLKHLSTEKGLKETHRILGLEYFTSSELENIIHILDNQFKKPFLSIDVAEELINQIYDLTSEYVSIVENSEYKIKDDKDTNLYGYLADLIYRIKETIYKENINDMTIINKFIELFMPHTDAYYNDNNIDKRHLDVAISVLNNLLIESFINFDSFFFLLIKNQYIVKGLENVSTDPVSSDDTSSNDYDVIDKQVNDVYNYNLDYLVFVSIYYYYCLEFTNPPDNFKTSKDQFFDGDLVKCFNNLVFANCKSTNDLVNLIKNFFNFFKSTKEDSDDERSYLFAWKNRPPSAAWRFKFFDRQYLSDWWINMYLNSDSTNVDDLVTLINNDKDLTESDLYQIYLSLIVNWKNNRKTGYKKSKIFEKYFSIFNITYEISDTKNLDQLNKLIKVLPKTKPKHDD